MLNIICLVAISKPLSPPRHQGRQNEDFDLKIKRFPWSLGALVVNIVLFF
jgi:hypothetical protein